MSAKPLRALEEIRRMRGGSQSHLMRCSDDHYYVVKFQNNPQHRRVLVNELLATRLAARLGLPTTPTAIVNVSKELIHLTGNLVIELASKRIPCQEGLQFGSRLFGKTGIANTFASLPQGHPFPPEQLGYFAGMLVFDKWTCNTDGRQTLFLRESEGQRHSMVMIDQGFCFNCGEWNFPDSPLRGLYTDKEVYQEIKSIDDFEPWLGRLETEFTRDALFDAAKSIPPEWYEFDAGALSALLERLNHRRSIVRELLWVACNRLPSDFPKWVDRQQPGGHFRSPEFGAALY